MYFLVEITLKHYTKILMRTLNVVLKKPYCK